MCYTHAMSKIILIGGAPTAGKTFVAKQLSKILGLPWISTDTVREQMREIVRREEYPELFHFFDPPINVEEYFKIHTSKEIVENQNKESKEVWKGIQALIENDYVLKSFIVEGVAVLPELVSTLSIKDKIIAPIFLMDEDVGRIHDVVFTRGLWDDADTYPDSVKDKEVAWVQEFNIWLKKECEKYDYPIFFRGEEGFNLEEIMTYLK